MSDLTTLQDQIAAAQQQLAAADLATLQAFQALITNPTSTIDQLTIAMGALPASLGDPARQSAVVAILGGYQAFLGNLATLISQANAVANPGA